MRSKKAFRRVQAEYERLRAEHPNATHKTLWHQAEQAVSKRALAGEGTAP